MNIRALLVLTVGGVASFFLQREQDRGTFAALDHGHVDWLLANRKSPVLQAKPNVTLARLDDIDHAESERQFESWPPTREEWSLLLDEISTYAPKTLVVQSASTWVAGEADEALKKSAGAIKGLLLGTRGEAQGSLSTESLLEITQVTGDVAAVPNFQSVSGGEALSALGGIGMTQIDLSDTDLAKPSVKSGVGRVPLLFRQGKRVMPSLILRALLQQEMISIEQVKVELGSAIRLGPAVSIPIDAAGGFLYHDHLVNRQELPTVNLDTFKMTREQMERFLPKEDPARAVLPAVQNGLLWIGEDDQASKRFGLADGNVSLAELSARALMAMQTGRNVAKQSLMGQFVTLGAVLIYGLFLSRKKRSAVWKWGIFGAMLLGLASMLTFQSSGEWMPVGAALVVLGLVTLLNLLVGPAMDTKVKPE